jgi:hypothetical protein
VIASFLPFYEVKKENMKGQPKQKKRSTWCTCSIADTPMGFLLMVGAKCIYQTNKLLFFACINAII